MATRKLSIIIPAYNEEATIGKVLDRIWAVALTEDIAREVIVQDGDLLLWPNIPRREKDRLDRRRSCYMVHP